MTLRREYFLLFLSPLLLAVIGMGIVQVFHDGRLPQRQTAVDGESLYREVMDIVDQQYVIPPEREPLIYAAVKGLVGSLDPHCFVYDPAEWKTMQVDNAGHYPGIGIYAGILDDKVTVYRVLPESPAAKAGIAEGCRIVAVDGQVVPEHPVLSRVLERLRGSMGSPVALVVTAFDGSASRELEVVPGEVKQETCFGRMVNATVGYVRITSFRGNTDEMFRAVLRSLQEAGATGVVIDLRSNGGGMLDVAVAIADLFIAGGPIVAVIGRNEREERFAHPGGTDLTLALAVLIGRQSASASEVLAGALQDHARAVLVGDRSFGKGVVQTIIPFRSWPGGVKITTAHYFTPAGRCIEKSLALPDDRTRSGGLEPDVFVPCSERELERALFVTELYRYGPWVREAIIEERTADGEIPEGFEDKQLQAALGVLAGRNPDRKLAQN